MAEKNSYIIWDNPKNNAVEVEFGDMPSVEMRTTIACMGMHYSSERGRWYGIGITEDDLREAVEDVLAGRKGRFTPGDGTKYSITRNDQDDSVEVRFNGKPSDAVRKALRGLGMRWHKLNFCWYGNATEDQVRAAIEQATLG